jgi:hypothetical protein
MMALAGGTGLNEFDRDADAWQLEALGWRAAVAERLGAPSSNISRILIVGIAENAAKAFENSSI